MKEHALYSHSPANGHIELMEFIFVQREVQIWSQSESWTLLMDCMKDLVDHFDAQAFEEKQTQLRESYEELEEFFDELNATAEIEDSLFTVDPQSGRMKGLRSVDYTDNIPEVELRDIIDDLPQRQMEEQLNAMMVENNVPADHNLLRLFFEALNPEMNANELNDDDVAALQEQVLEMMNAQNGGMMQPGGEEEAEVWQEDWNSDEEAFRVYWHKQSKHPASSQRSARDSSEWFPSSESRRTAARAS